MVADLQRLTEADFREGFDNPEGDFLANAPLSFDTTSFDFGPYAAIIYRIVKSNWKIPIAAHLGKKGKTELHFRIQANGTITDLSLIRSSQISSLDNAALAAIRNSNQLPPLPEDFTEDSVGVTWGFFYNMRE